MTSILTTLADEFKQLASQLNSSPPITMEIGGFTQACRRVSPVLKHLGPAMGFASTEYSAQVSVIENAGNAVNTLKDLLDGEIKQQTFMPGGSASRSLVRVKRSLEMLKIIFEKTIASSGDSFKDQVDKAYKAVFYDYHGLVERAAFEAALLLLPSRSLFFKRVKLDEKSALVQMKKTVKALDHLIDYINNLFNSRKAAKKLLTLP